MSNRLNGLHKQELARHSPKNHVYKYKKNFRFYPKVQKFGADGQIRSFVIQSLQASADVASHMFEIPHKFLHSLFIIRKYCQSRRKTAIFRWDSKFIWNLLILRSNKNRRQTASGDISKDMSQRYLGLCISEHSLNRSFCQFVTSSSFTTFPFVVTICIFSSFAMCSLDSGSE